MILLIPMLAIILTACSGKESDAPSCETNSFSFSSSGEPLGSSIRFEETLRETQKSPNPITLGDVTRAAGWTVGWDRMVEVWSLTTVEKLDSAAGVPRGQVCWKDWPKRSFSDDSAPIGYFVFLSGGKPLQAVESHLDQALLDLRDLPALTPQTLLVSAPDGSGLIPAS